MKLGVGLVGTIPGTKGPLNLEWAEKAEARGFSTLGMIDRLVYPNYEPITTLAAVAGATTKIRLMTTVLILPARETHMAAKQIATLDQLSEGRLTLGLGLGSRPDDINATEETAFEKRGGHLGRQIRLMKRIWSGERLSEDTGEIGPEPFQKGGPAILLGGSNPNTFSRIGRLADGYISSGGMDATAAYANFKKAEDSWQANKREGRPRFVGCQYFALGEDAMKRGAFFLRDYYGAYGENLTKAMLSDEDRVRHALDSFSSAGADELVFWPTIPDIAQLDLLEDAISGYPKS